MDRRNKSSSLNPRHVIICVTTTTVIAVWAVIFVAVYFYFFGSSSPSGDSSIEDRVTSRAPPRPDQLPWYLGGTRYPPPSSNDELVPLWAFQAPPTATPGADPLQRIRDQLMFLPKGSGETKIVLFWSDWSPSEVDDYKTRECPVKSCVFTNSRKSLSKASAVVFRNPTKLLNNFPQEYRPRSQVWIFNSLSIPKEEFTHPRDVFNWTATPRLDSDIPMFPHGVWMYYDPTWKHQDPPYSIAMHKTLAAAAWFPRTCNATGYPTNPYVLKLAHYTLVDVYGRCGDPCPQNSSQLCHKLLQEKYRVTLVTDDSWCNHSLPDMFYQALAAETIPVVMHPTRSVYEQFVPGGSFIHVDDFPSPRDLAWHLDQVYSSDAVFNSYLSWRSTGLFVKSWYCRVCAMLHHNSLPDLVIDDINQWWSPEGECVL